ncbi:hypothetical protein MRB53_040436 [Persea americana]|nr:hypothetical protein MRB53_040436 [Persea americana]
MAESAQSRYHQTTQQTERATESSEKLPFDLGTIRDLRNGEGLAAQSETNKSRVLTSSRLDSDSQFTQLLLASDSDDFMAYLKTLGPAQLDISIRSLSPDSGFSEIIEFVKCMTNRLEQRLDYELCQVYMATLFKAHSDIIAENVTDTSALETALLRWQEFKKERE